MQHNVIDQRLTHAFVQCEAAFTKKCTIETLFLNGMRCVDCAVELRGQNRKTGIHFLIPCAPPAISTL